jgi:MoaA/NifB/PqqE/SkfB family radical SAM enzyme
MDELAAAGVMAIQFTGGGEPTVHPEHERIFTRAEELGLKRALVTNGVSMSDPLIAMLPRFSWVRVSIDAGTAETYAKVRDTPAGHFNKVWGNVTRLTHAIRLQPGCVLGIGYVVTPENWEEIGEGVRMAAESGAAYIRLSAMFSTDGAWPYRNIYGEIKNFIHEVADLWQRPDFKVHDLFGERLQDLEEGPPDYPVCYYQHYNTYIGGDLNVYRCCVLAYNKRGLLGSVKNQPYGEFLAKPATQNLLNSFDARGCERCQFNSKNRAMNYILGPKPAHAEFP